MYKICDIHSHILYGIDDGAKNLTMSMKMLREAHKQGTQNIICTSHSYGNQDKYNENLNILKKYVKQENLSISLYSGCEIYCTENTAKNIIKNLNNGYFNTINHTKYILLEFNPYASITEITNCVNYILSYNYNIILAHVERYVNLIQSLSCIEFLLKQGCLLQINAYSLQDERDVYIKSAARMLLNYKYVSFVGSDSHRIDHRPYMIKNGIDYIYQNCDNEYVQNVLYRNAEYILNIK